MSVDGFSDTFIHNQQKASVRDPDKIQNKQELFLLLSFFTAIIFHSDHFSRVCLFFTEVMSLSALILQGNCLSDDLNKRLKMMLQNVKEMAWLGRIMQMETIEIIMK